MPEIPTQVHRSSLRAHPLLALVAIAAWLPALGAQAQPAEAPVQQLRLAPDAHAYALVVGSNAGGPGQEALAFAERDAERVADVLVELGSYRRARVDLLRSPSRQQLATALGRLRQRLAQHAQRDEQTVVFFYYSGHAQAQALRLGNETFALRDLRAAIDALPATLRLVVLDACQSGAYSTVRSADATADFSHNSIAQLQTTGVAVLASSSSAELSQESARLSAGYFTHHLLVALRGAADENNDGRVALDEAYRYAYAQTLSDTSRTAVGGQHVTLDTNLTGHGAVAITYPSRASARLEFPADVAGELLITRARGGAVIAELRKVAGTALRLALPAGRYRVLWRGESMIRDCEVRLSGRRVHTLSTARCEEITAEQATAREANTGPSRVWGLELGIGAARENRGGAYIGRLETFGYQNGAFDLLWNVRLSAAVERQIYGNMSVLLTFESLEARDYTRGFFDDSNDLYSWRAWAVGLQLRGTLPLAGHWLYGYAQGGAGLGIARTTFDPGREQDSSLTQTHYGVQLSGALGVRFMPWRHGGFYLQAGYTYAPILQNDLGDRHDSGGFAIVTGLRIRL